MASVKEKVLAVIGEGRTKADAENIYSKITEALRTQLVDEGDSLRFQGFGTLSVVRRAARQGRNPRTGESIQIPEKLIIKFTPAQKS